MEYVYAALILNESGEEINEENVTAILEAGGVDVEQSRVKALIAALEDVDIEESIEMAATAPAGGAGGAASAGGSAGAADGASADEAEAEPADDDGDDEAEAEPADDDDEEDDDASGEGLGQLFG